MNIQPIIPQLNTENKDSGKVKFTGAFDAFTLGLRFLETNQAWGANAVDIGSMVLPRTTIDFINRGPAAGMETGRREASGTINHSLVGVYGTIAGFLLAAALDRKYGVKAYKMFTDDQTLEILGKVWDNQVKTGNTAPLNAYLKELFKNAETRINDDWVKLPEECLNKVVKKLSDALNYEYAPNTIPKDLKAYLQSVITHATGSESSFRLSENHLPTSLSNLLDSVYNVAKTFNSENSNIKNAFNENISKNSYLNALKKMNKHRSMLGLGIASAVGMSIQPLNIYLTKKKTGSDGFVGVEGRQKDNSVGFKLLKVATAAVFGGGILATIGLKGGVNGLLKKIQFKGLVPTLDQFKFIYGMTIMSRFMAARDKDELRESAVKDVLGFFNWLVLGNFVAKMTANAMDTSLLNYSEKEHGKGFFNKIIKAPMFSRDEILHKGLKAANIDTIENGKALTFKQMLKKLADSRVPDAIRKGTQKKLRILSLAQVAGYLYSGLILGVGIPKLNIYMTNKSEVRRKAKLAEQKATENTQNKSSLQYQNMLKPENMVFLSNNM